MTDQPENLGPYRMPWRQDRLKQVGALTPMLRYIPKNPLFLLGAAAVGIAGVLAWRNRDRIATAAGPLLADARIKGQALVDEAKHKGEDLLDQARATGEAVVAKASRVRRRATPEKTLPDLH